MEAFMTYLFLIGRLIFGVYFIFSGLNHFMQMKMMTGYAQSKGVPMPSAAIAITGAMLILGGLSIALGAFPRIGILILFVFLAPVTFMMHNYWKVQDPQAKMGEMINFLKNAALMGALLMMIMIHRPWPFRWWW
jgi:putative oxidoreductase